MMTYVQSSSTARCAHDVGFHKTLMDRMVKLTKQALKKGLTDVYGNPTGNAEKKNAVFVSDTADMGQS